MASSSGGFSLAADAIADIDLCSAFRGSSRDFGFDESREEAVEVLTKSMMSRGW